MCDVKCLNERWKQLLSEPSAQTFRRERLKYGDLHVEGHTFEQLIVAKARILAARRQFMDEAGWHPYAEGYANRLAPWSPRAG